MNRAIAVLTLIVAVTAGVSPVWASDAASGRMHRIGYLLARGPDPAVDNAFFQGLREMGYIEGKNVVVLRRYADNDFTRLPQLAADLVQQRVDIIVAAPFPAVLAAKKTTSQIPIVMLSGGDPVATGLVDSFSRPGGNITGVSNQADDVFPKMIELLSELIPGTKRIALLINPNNRIHDSYVKVMQDSMRTLRLQPLFVKAGGMDDYESAFAEAALAKVDGMIIPQDPIYFNHRKNLVALAARYGIPTMAPFREFAESGGLVSYGRNLSDGFRKMASYVDRIIKGAQPGDLPIEQPTLFELIVNARAAKEFGVKIPKSILGRADQIIE